VTPQVHLRLQGQKSDRWNKIIVRINTHEIDAIRADRLDLRTLLQSEGQSRGLH